MRAEDLVAAIHYTLEGRRAFVQFAPHSNILGPLPGEQERDGRQAQVGHFAGDYIGDGFVPYKCAQAVPYLFGILTQNRYTVCEMRTSRVRGKANIRERISVCVLQAERKSLHKFVECLVALARQSQEVDRTFGCGPRPNRFLGLFQNEVRVGTAKTERTQARDALA